MTFIQTKINVLEDLVQPSSHMPEEVVQLMSTELNFLKNEFSRANLKVVINELVLGYIEGAMTTDGDSGLPTAQIH